MANGSNVEACVFCRIVQGDDRRTEIICEGDSWVAFFPTEPATPGHTLVVPRAHVPDVWSLDAALAADLMRAVVHVGRAIQMAVTPAGMNLISSSGTAAEQTVFHLHLHVVPRYPGDDIDPIWPEKAPTDNALKQQLGAQIRNACVTIGRQGG
jgi:histidine triad (HIT) family protein